MTCLLCTLEARTRWYTETPQWVILQCDTCGVPMAVWRAHTEAIPEAEKAAMLAELARVADLELGGGALVARQHPSHDPRTPALACPRALVVSASAEPLDHDSAYVDHPAPSRFVIAG
jgi:hypothetical protein